MAETPSPRTRINLTQRGRVLLIMLVMATIAAGLTGDSHTRLAAAMLFGPLVADWLATPRHLHRIRMSIGSRRVAAMAPFREQVRLQLPDDCAEIRDLRVREPATQSVRDGWGWLPTLRSGGDQTGDQQVMLRARSRTRGHQLERVLAVSSAFPLGLLRARAVHRVPSELVTEPGRVALPRDLLRRTARQHSEPEAPRRNPGGDFHSLREYQTGDDARSVHALRSAATGMLVRRELRGDPPQEWDLVLDLRLAPNRAYRRRGEDEVILPRHVWQAFEWQLGACASLLDRLSAEHQRGSLWILGADGHRQLPLGDGGASRAALAQLAVLSPSQWVSAEDVLLEHFGGRPCLWLPAGGAWPEDEWAAAGIHPLMVQSPRDPAR